MGGPHRRAEEAGVQEGEDNPASTHDGDFNRLENCRPPTGDLAETETAAVFGRWQAWCVLPELRRISEPVCSTFEGVAGNGVKGSTPGSAL